MLYLVKLIVVFIDLVGHITHNLLNLLPTVKQSKVKSIAADGLHYFYIINYNQRDNIMILPLLS